MKSFATNLRLYILLKMMIPHIKIKPQFQDKAIDLVIILMFNILRTNMMLSGKNVCLLIVVLLKFHPITDA